MWRHGNAGASILVQIDISEDLIGQTYGELFAHLTLTQHLIPLGLYRRCASSIMMIHVQPADVWCLASSLLGRYLYMKLRLVSNSMTCAIYSFAW